MSLAAPLRLAAVTLLCLGSPCPPWPPTATPAPGNCSAPRDAGGATASTAEGGTSAPP